MNHHSADVPKTGVSFYIKVDGAVLTFDHRHVKGREILHAAGKDPVKDFDLYMKVAGGGRKLIAHDEAVDLEADGIEKFHSIPHKRTDGRGGVIPPPLTQEDIQLLEEQGLAWETTTWSGNVLLKIKKVPVPLGYNHQEVDLCFIIPMTYPAAQIDMFYFFPALQRVDGRPIHALADQNFDGAIWQRWSRHRTEESRWRPDLDDVGTHLAFMQNCLRDELGR